MTDLTQSETTVTAPLTDSPSVADLEAAIRSAAIKDAKAAMAAAPPAASAAEAA